MSDLAVLRTRLLELQAALASGPDHFGSNDVRRALREGSEGLRGFLVSNALWGGSGSIADQAGVGSAARGRIERALVALGTAQLHAGVTNERTQMWVSAFTSSRRPGI